MKIFKMSHTLGWPRVFATPSHELFVEEFLDQIPAVSRDAKVPAFQLADIEKKGLPFYQISPSILCFNKTVYLGPLGRILSFCGDVFETRLNDTGEEIFLLNVTAMYNCIDHANTIYNARPPLRQERGVDHQMGIKVPAFFPGLIGDSSVFRIPQHQQSAIYVASRGHEDSDDFYYMYQQSGLKGLEFRQVWDGD
ncbi:hypothetical protein [Prosthecobacter sp.]|uniref:hypothetical protein n=1 Tax=Prosthecobacter sp. TaxID=1965333 RepID=UPI003783B1B2